MALKDEDYKALISYIGLDPDKLEDVAAAKTAFNEKHIARDMAVKDPEIKAAVTGAVMGGLFTEAKRTFKDLGVDFEEGEVPKNDLKALFEIGKTKVGAKIDDLTKAQPDVDKWQKEIAKKDQKLADISGLLESTKTRLAEVENEKTTAVKGVKLDIAKKELYGNLKFSSTVDEVRRRGFEAIISDKYKLDIEDETGKAIIVDAKTNARIQSTAKSSEFATPDEIFASEAEKLGLLAKIDDKRVNLQQQQQRTDTGALNPDGVTRNRIAPANAK